MFLNINELGYNVPSIGPRKFPRIGPSIDPSMDSNTLNVIPVQRYDDASRPEINAIMFHFVCIATA